MKTSVKVVILLIVLVFLCFFVRATDWSGVLASIKQVGFNFLILMFITFLSAWLGMLGWRYCLPKDGAKVSGWQLYWIRMIGENVAILNPASMIGGEAAKIYMLTDLGIPRRQALHSIILSRALTIISQILMLLIAGIWFLHLTINDWSWPDISGWWMLVMILIIAASVLLWRSTFFRKMMRAFFRLIRILEPYRKARTFLTELRLELGTFYRENRRAMFLSFLCCSLHWIVGSLEFYFILLFLGVKTTVAKALLVDMGVIVFKSAGGFIPGQIGIEEYGNKVMLGIIGIAGNTIWVTASILRRTRQLCWILISALMYFVYFHRRPAILKS